MNTSLKALFHSILVIGSVVALSNCGNSKNEDESQTGTTVPRQKNAALSFTTLPAKMPPGMPPKATNPAVNLPTTTISIATNPADISTTSIAKTVTTPLPSPPSTLLPKWTTTTSISRTVTTPVPKLPKRKP